MLTKATEYLLNTQCTKLSCTVSDDRVLSCMRRYWFLLPFLLAVIVRAPMIAPAFVYDDVPLVEEHEHLDEPAFAWSSLVNRSAITGHC